MEKKKIPVTENQLLLENEELHRRLYELEETLNSIRNGEIDAIVVSGVAATVITGSAEGCGDNKSWSNSLKAFFAMAGRLSEK